MIRYLARVGAGLQTGFLEVVSARRGSGLKVKTAAGPDNLIYMANSWKSRWIETGLHLQLGLSPRGRLMDSLRFILLFAAGMAIGCDGTDAPASGNAPNVVIYEVRQIARLTKDALPEGIIKWDNRYWRIIQPVLRGDDFHWTNLEIMSLNEDGFTLKFPRSRRGMTKWEKWAAKGVPGDIAIFIDDRLFQVRPILPGEGVGIYRLQSMEDALRIATYLTRGAEEGDRPLPLPEENTPCSRRPSSLTDCSPGTAMNCSSRSRWFSMNTIKSGSRERSASWPWRPLSCPSSY